MTDPAAVWRYPGARWWKFDVHAHTPASRDFRDNMDPREWLLACMGAGLDCVAITDHNSGEWIDRLKLALQALEEQPPAEFRPLQLFPGVELSVNGGLHLLAIFDLAATTADINNLLGAVGYQGTRGCSDGVTSKSAVETIRAVLDAGAIPLPAHVDGPKGLLEPRDEAPASPRLDPQTLTLILDCGEILAVEVVDPSIPKPQVYGERRLTWTEVLGSDAHESVALGLRYTWVKMARPSLDALRLALLDGAGYSIRRSDEAESSIRSACRLIVSKGSESPTLATWGEGRQQSSGSVRGLTHSWEVVAPASPRSYMPSDWCRDGRVSSPA